MARAGGLFQLAHDFSTFIVIAAAICAQLVEQPCARPVQAHLHGFDRERKPFCDIVIRQLIELAEEVDLPVYFRQFFNKPEIAFDHVTALQVFLGRSDRRTLAGPISFSWL